MTEVETKINLEPIEIRILNLLDTILTKIEEPLREKKPNAKAASYTIKWYQERIRKLRVEFQNEETESESRNKASRNVYTYKCLYQCGFTTQSIREIDTHLTKEHSHPDPKRDYSHTIYNEN